MEVLNDVIGRILRGMKGIVQQVSAFGELTALHGDQDEPVQQELFPAEETSFACPLCKDWGIIPFTIKGDDKVPTANTAYTTNARCKCARGQALPDRIATFAELFGRWPTREEADFLRATRADGRSA